MLKVLLVDDEEFSLQGMQDLVPWEKWNCSISAVANNGKMAMDILEKEDIDIVFTDIKMPEMDGLELIREAGKINHNVHFVILTGYSEFEYAQKAVKYGVSSYLLKPVGIAEIEETLLLLTEQNKNEKDDQRECRKNILLDLEPFIDEIFLSVAQKNWNRISEILLGFFKEITSKGGQLEEARKLAIRLLSCLIKKEIIYSNESTLLLAGEIGSASSQSGIYNILKDQILITQNQQISCCSRKMNPHIQKVLIYLLTHYNEKRLSLKWLSENVTYVKPDYLGKLFLQETGKKFQTYLAEFRIARAVEFIRDDKEIPVQDLARKVGYNDNVSYFIQQYKHITGMTPLEYAGSTVVYT